MKFFKFIKLCFIYLFLTTSQACSVDEMDKSDQVLNQRETGYKKDIYLLNGNLTAAINTNIPYIKNLPVHQLKVELISIPVSIDDLIIFTQNAGYKKSGGAKSFDLFSDSDFKNISTLELTDNTESSFFKVFFTNSSKKNIHYILSDLTYYDELGQSLGVIKNTYPTSLVINMISKTNIEDSKAFYENLLKDHILNIERKYCKYSDYFITTRENFEGYWFELNTSVIGKGTSLYIYKTNATPKVGFPVKKQGYC